MILLLGTANEGKIREIRALLSGIPALELLTRREILFPDIEELGETFAENALRKARGIAATAPGVAVLAEDSGLRVDALDGAPGVRSARFAGVPTNHRANVERLLERMRGTDHRAAQFVTVAVLRLGDGREILRAGVLPGRITRAAAGHGGFGYDPVFVPDGYDVTLAELPAEVKNRISHRRRALAPLAGVLREIATTD